jgi:hypothetical protein
MKFIYDNVGVDRKRTVICECKNETFQMMLSIQSCFSLRVVKEIIIWKTDFRDVWIRFLLNQALYTDESKIFGIPQNIEQIKVILFSIENQLTTFRYCNHEFCLVLNNDRNIGDVETELKYKAGFGSDISFYGFGDRKL